MGTNGSKIRAIAEPIAAERGLEVLDVEVTASGSSQLVCLFLDTADGSGLVSIDDCTAVSRRLGDALDAHEAVLGHYMLEVSSPGLNRLLKTPAHFARVVGQKVRVRTNRAEEGRRTRLGRLVEVDDVDIVVVDEAGNSARIALAEIDKANLEFEFEAKPAPRRRR